MYFKYSKHIKIHRIYGRLRGIKGSSFHYGSSNLSKNKEERGRLTFAHAHAVTFKCKWNWANKSIANIIEGKDEVKKEGE